MAHSDDPPFLNVGTEVSAKYRGAFCEATIKVAKKLVRCKVTYSKGQSGVVNNDVIKGSLKVGAQVEVRQTDSQYQSATILRLTDMSTYTVVFDDGDERTLKRSSLCLKGARHFLESETLDRLPLTDPENFGTPVMQSSRKRKRRRLSHNSSAEEGSTKKKVCYPPEFPVGKTVFLENDRRRSCWLPAVVVPVHYVLEESEWTPDTICIRSFKDGRFFATTKVELHDFAPDKEPLLSMLEGEIQAMYMHKPAIERAMAYRDTGELPWNMNLFEPKIEFNSSPSPVVAEEEEEEKDEESEERKLFMERITKFHEGKGSALTRQPTLGQKDLDLWKLYRLVQDNGGFDKVTQEMKWRSLYLQLGMPSMSTASYVTKQAYKRYIYPLEAQDKAKSKVGKDSPARGSRRRTGIATPPAATPTTPAATSVPSTPPTITHESDEERGGKAVGRPLRQSPRDPSKGLRERSESKSDGSDQESSHADSISTQSTSEESIEDRPPPPSHSAPSSSSSKPNGALPLREECFAENERVLIWYGKGKAIRTYEAKILGMEETDQHRDYLVHYSGWNIRYDEWVEESRIAGKATSTCPGNTRPVHSKKRKGKKEGSGAPKVKKEIIDEKAPGSPENNTKPSTDRDSQEAPPTAPPTTQPSAPDGSSSIVRGQGRVGKRRRPSTLPEPPCDGNERAASPPDPHSPSSSESGSRKVSKSGDCDSFPEVPSPVEPLRAEANDVEGNGEEEGEGAIEVKREENLSWRGPSSEPADLLCAERLPEAPDEIRRRLEIVSIKTEKESSPDVTASIDGHSSPPVDPPPAQSPDHTSTPPSPTVSPPHQHAPSPPQAKEEEEEEEEVKKMEEEESNGKSSDDKSSVTSSSSEKESSPVGHRRDRGQGHTSKGSPGEGKRKSREWETGMEYEERRRQRRAEMNYLIDFSSLPEMSSSERVALIQERLREVHKKWSQLKAEVNYLDRKRRRARRKEREATRSHANQTTQHQQSSVIECH